MQITMEQIKSIYAAHDMDMSDRDFQMMLDQCNEQDGMSGRNAEDWACFFAGQEANEQRADDAATRQFHRDAYGDD